MMEQNNIKKGVVEVIHKGKSLTIKSQDVKRELPKYLEPDFINEKIEELKPGMNRMLITFLWMSGVRVTEAISVRKQDIDFKNNIVRLSWLKNRKFKERHIPIHSKLSPLLYWYCGQINQEDKLFPITRQRAFQITKQFLGASPHQLRHSFAVHFLRSGGDIISLHRLLGHSKIQTTMEYLKIVPQDLAISLEKVGF